ncbi:M1 family aminopeptidase [Reichenbachiella ulvae]|uniref:Aminopeptidase N n=1 Tax=Reichenbachiella ulvae TaxID=2980104 RepID=A0ABT3CZ53_9BACT|nr:M1 family aminopeptidase [Reichenbachiella ulvae]MCV9388976.1 M1 family aminopeptidase [Reichenbachiella ulvae]
MHKTTTILLMVLLPLVSWSQEADSAYEYYEEPAIYRATETRYFDLIHTDLEVSFDWSKEQLIGKAELVLKPLFYAQQDVTLDAKAMMINSVTLKGKQNQKLSYEYDGYDLQVKLDRMYERTDTLTLIIDYIARPNEWKGTGSEAITQEKGLYFINSDGSDPYKPQQIWTQGETESNSVWFPTLDYPNERCTQEISMTVQDRFRTLSNGVLIEQVKVNDSTRIDTWRLDTPHAPYLFMMSIGEYAVIEDKWKDIPLAYHVEKEYAEDAKAIFGHTPEMIGFFSDVLGVDFPWPKYDQVVVRDFVSGAMENTTASVFMEQLQVSKKELLDSHWDDIIAHELFHQWFGDYVTCESWSNLTLNEGFASYSEYLWNEHKYGLDEADYNFINDRESYFEEAAEDPKDLLRYYYEDKEDMFDRHSYNKGAAVLHMLRNYVGDEAFFAALNLYLEENALESVELANLRMAFEEVSGEDLNWFFDQWYFFPGHPEIVVTETFENDSLTLLVQQIQSEDFPTYKLPLFVEIWQGEESETYPIILESEVETYQFAMKEEPSLVIFDTERQLLAEVNHAKSPEALAFQMSHSDRFESRMEVMEALAEISDKKLIQQILIQALKDPFYAIKQYALNYMIDNKVKIKKYESLVLACLKDESSQVRSYTLSYLAETDFEEYLEEFKKALEDESYLVQSTALTYLFEYDLPVDPKLIAGLSAEKNINVVLAMSAYYLKQDGEDSFDWFEEKIKVVDDETLYFLLHSYSEKLIKASDARRKAAVSTYAEIAKNHPTYYTRLSAYQGLVLMSDLEGVSDLLDEIKESETDERLKEYYDQF